MTGRRSERGAAVADFAMVSLLLLAIFLAVLQLALTLYARNVLIASASEGARLGARADAVPGEAAARTRFLVSSSLSPRYAEQVSTRRTSVDGVEVVEVRVAAPVPVLGLLGPDGRLDVVGRAFAEDQ